MAAQLHSRLPSAFSQPRTGRPALPLTLIRTTAPPRTARPVAKTMTTWRVHTIGASIGAGLFVHQRLGAGQRRRATTEANETFFVNISSVTNAGVADAQGLGTIVNDDGVAPSGVVISQVYGGGGNSGATYRNDFIELYNRSATPIDITGWSVQFTAPTSAFAATSSTGTPLTTNLSRHHSAGPLLFDSRGSRRQHHNHGPSSDAGRYGCDCGRFDRWKGGAGQQHDRLERQLPGLLANGIVDFVAYGAADCSETSPAPGTSNLVAAIRNNNGCTDTDNNSADFSVTGANSTQQFDHEHVCGKR